MSQTEDPKIHDLVMGMQKNVLNQLLHQNVLKRLLTVAFMETNTAWTNLCLILLQLYTRMICVAM